MPTANSREENVQRLLGEIIGELKAVSAHNEMQSKTLESIRSMVHQTTADVAAVRATQVHQGDSLKAVNDRLDTLEIRVKAQEIIGAKHGAIFGTIAAGSVALVVEALKSWLSGR